MTRGPLVRVLVAALAVLAAWPAAASAHALLEATTPTRGAELGRAPASVSFRFSEGVDAGPGAVRVFDGHGREVQQGGAYHPGGRADTVAVRLPGGLSNGGFTATYRVISADTHPVSGGITFAVGHGGAAARGVDRLLAGTVAGPVTTTALATVRALQFAAIALAVGCLLFLMLCWLPSIAAVAGGEDAWRRASEAFDGRVRRLLATAAGVGAVAAAAGVLLQGAIADGTSLWSALRPAVVEETLQTRFGTVWGLALLAWLAVAVVAVSPRVRFPVLRPASLGATGLAAPGVGLAPVVLAVPLAFLCLLPALGGHAGVESPTWLMLPANVVHVVCVSGWMGGLAVMVVALRRGTAELEASQRTRLLGATVGRFSAWAGVAVAVILATGVAQSLMAIDAWSELLDTAYGRAVLIKVALFTVLLAIGWVNRNRVLPRLRDATEAGASPGAAGVSLRRSLRAEVALGVVVLAVTGALSTYVPAKSVAQRPVSVDAVVGPARLEATLDPARIGPNELHLYFFDRRSGAAWTRTKELTVSAASSEHGVSDLPIPVRRAGPGHFVATGATLPSAGTWTLSVTSRVSDFAQYTGKFDVRIR